MNSPNDLQFLSLKSKELVEKQINTFRQQHSTSSSIIAIIALFIPLFLNGLTDAPIVVKYLSIVPVLLFVLAVCILLLCVFRTEALLQSSSFQSIETLLNQDIETVLLYEIGSNKTSFEYNKPILLRRNKFYNFSIIFTVVAIVFSTALLLLNNFNETSIKTKKPIEVIIKNTIPIAHIRDTILKEKKIIIVKNKYLRSKCCPNEKVTNYIDNLKIENQNINMK